MFRGEEIDKLPLSKFQKKNNLKPKKIEQSLAICKFNFTSLNLFPIFTINQIKFLLRTQSGN